MLKIAQNLAREASAKHTELRLTQLEDHAETSALEGNHDKQKHLKQMAHESSCKMYSKIRSVRGLNSKSGQFTSLQIPADWPTPDVEISKVESLSNPKAIAGNDSKWRTIDLPADIMHYL